MKKVVLLGVCFFSFMFPMEEKSAREKYGHCLGSATGKDLWRSGYNFSEDTYYKVHLKCCIFEYQRGVFLDCFPLKQGKVIQNHTDCNAYCEENLKLYGLSGYKTCLQQCALVYQINNQLKQ